MAAPAHAGRERRHVVAIRAVGLLVAGLLLAALGRATADAATDPAARGPYPVKRSSYDLPSIRLAGMPSPVEVEGELTRPVGAEGARPLVVILHGMHRTCRRSRRTDDGYAAWPCAKGYTPVPSALGYRWLAAQLASQGNVVVSLSANGVNAQSNERYAAGAHERASLVRLHLARLARWNRDGGGPFDAWIRGAIDMDRVVLMGHSRGGEAMAQLVTDVPASAPWRVRGLALIAPTDFGRQVTPGVDTMVLLPYCDGDVSDLQGQQFVDNRSLLVAGDTSLRTSVMLLGANHNAFNTVWAADGSNGNDWTIFYGDTSGKRTCEPRNAGRLTAAAQRTAALPYLAALVRLSTEDDPDAARLLTGVDPAPASVGKAGVLVSPVYGADRLLFGGATPGALTSSGGMTAKRCVAYRRGAGASCAGTTDQSRQPHWTPVSASGPFPAPSALRVSWATSGGTTSLPLPAGGVDLTADASIAVRYAADPDVRGQRIQLRLTDASGATAEPPVAGAQPVDLPRSSTTEVLPKYWGQTVRYSLDQAGIDLAHVTGISIVAVSRRGRGWVLDVAREGPIVRPVAAPTLPAVGVPWMTVREPGDRGSRVVLLRLRLRGTVTQPAQLSVLLQPDRGASRWRLVSVPAGATSITVPVAVKGDRRRTGTTRYRVLAFARRDIVVSHYDGGVAVLDDESARTR